MLQIILIKLNIFPIQPLVDVFLSSDTSSITYIRKTSHSTLETSNFQSSLQINVKEYYLFIHLKEIKQVISLIDRRSPSGKRDLAIILLASELGIRSSDICKLMLENLHWERGTIEFIQHKTKKFQQLPMTEKVRFALLDYIKNARSACSYNNVFIGIKNKNTPFSNTSIHYFVSKYFKMAEIDISERKHGPHALRNSLATNLMHNNTPMHVIKDVLGHTNINTTKVYLNIDLNTLKQVALEVPNETV